MSTAALNQGAKERFCV